MKAEHLRLFGAILDVHRDVDLLSIVIDLSQGHQTRILLGLLAFTHGKLKSREGLAEMFLQVVRLIHEDEVVQFRSKAEYHLPCDSELFRPAPESVMLVSVVLGCR